MEGVATVELGGASQPIYYFDCSSTTNNGSGEREEREESKNHIAFAIQCHCICSLVTYSVQYNDLSPPPSPPHRTGVDEGRSGSEV